jgi:hypothetical protein
MPTYKLTVPERARAETQAILDLMSQMSPEVLYEEIEEPCPDTLRDDSQARDADAPPRCGDLVEVNGFEYVVSQQHIDGTLELRLRDDLEDDIDSFFSH